MVTEIGGGRAAPPAPRALGLLPPLAPPPPLPNANAATAAAAGADRAAGLEGVSSA